MIIIACIHIPKIKRPIKVESTITFTVKEKYITTGDTTRYNRYIVIAELESNRWLQDVNEGEFIKCEIGKPLEVKQISYEWK